MRRACSTTHYLARFTPYNFPASGWLDSVDVARRAIRTCSTCGARLPLGPANDDDERVKVEIRAAELAALPRTWTLSGLAEPYRYPANIDGAELAGMIIWNYDSAKQPEQDGEWVGYLAACIAAHEEEAE